MANRIANILLAIQLANSILTAFGVSSKQAKKIVEADPSGPLADMLQDGTLVPPKAPAKRSKRKPSDKVS